MAGRLRTALLVAPLRRLGTCRYEACTIYEHRKTQHAQLVGAVQRSRQQVGQAMQTMLARTPADAVIQSASSPTRRSKTLPTQFGHPCPNASPLDRPSRPADAGPTCRSSPS